MTVLDRLEGFVLRPVGARRLGYVRIAIGLVALAASFDAGSNLRQVLAESAVTMPYVDLVPRLPADGAELFLAAWRVAALAFAIGWYTTLAGCVLLATLGYTIVVDQQTYSNHVHLLIWTVGLLTLAGAGAAVSCDAWLRGDSRNVSAGPVFLLKSQLSVVYAFAALTKINAVYLSGAVLAVVWRWDGPLAIPTALRTPALLSIAALTSVVAELFLAVALWFPNWRRLGVVVGVLLHLGMMAGSCPAELAAIAIFAVTSLSLYVLFFDEVPASQEVIPQQQNQMPACLVEG